MKYLFAAVYVLVLATQLPHVWHAYASLERPGFELATWTAIGAAVAFELSTGVFTFRVVQGSKRRWTRIGLMFFIAGSAVANAYYYAWWPQVFDRLMPVFATLALPASLALFAEEFGAEVKAEERNRKKNATPAAVVPTPAPIIAQRTATIVDWRIIRAGLNGDGANMDADRVADLVTGAGLALPSRRTVQAWAKETKED